MAGAGPITSATLAARTGTTERYVREWLGNQAAGGYVVYNSVDGTFELPAEQAMVVANEDTRSASAGPSRASQRATTTTSWSTRSAPGRGAAGRSMTTGCFSGVLWLFGPGYAAHLVDEWLPAPDGVVEKLRAGASVADVGCGLGASTIILAEAFQRSTFVGLDIHEPSIVPHPRRRRRRAWTGG